MLRCLGFILGQWGAIRELVVRLEDGERQATRAYGAGRCQKRWKVADQDAGPGTSQWRSNGTGPGEEGAAGSPRASPFLSPRLSSSSSPSPPTASSLMIFSFPTTDYPPLIFLCPFPFLKFPFSLSIFLPISDSSFPPSFTLPFHNYSSTYFSNMENVRGGVRKTLIWILASPRTVWSQQAGLRLSGQGHINNSCSPLRSVYPVSGTCRAYLWAFIEFILIIISERTALLSPFNQRKLRLRNVQLAQSHVARKEHHQMLPTGRLWSIQNSVWP